MPVIARERRVQEIVGHRGIKVEFKIIPESEEVE
jgi:hypothetical protein